MTSSRTLSCRINLVLPFVWTNAFTHRSRLLQRFAWAPAGSSTLNLGALADSPLPVEYTIFASAVPFLCGVEGCLNQASAVHIILRFPLCPISRFRETSRQASAIGKKTSLNLR